MNGTATPRWKKVLFSVVMLGIVAGTLELSAYLYLRHFEGYDGAHLLHYEFDPYKNILPARNYVDTRGIRHNSQGFRRSAEVSLRKPPGTYRIFLMGGSTAYGLGGLWPHIQKDYAVLDNSRTIDAYLERGLRRALPGTRVEVVNAAIPSIWTHHHLIYLNQTILRYDPDMVILVDGFNDFFFTNPGHDQFRDYAYHEHSHTVMGEPSLKALVYANVWWLARRSAFAYVAYRQYQNLGKVLRGRPEARTPMDVEKHVAGLRETFPRNALEMVDRTAGLLRDEGVRGVFVLQPMLILERNRRGMPGVERRLFEFNVESYLPDYEAFMHRAVPVVREMERRTVEENGGLFVDATAAFADTPGQVYTDYVHLTPRGNAVLARILGNRVLPLIREDLGREGEAPAAPRPDRPVSR